MMYAGLPRFTPDASVNEGFRLGFPTNVIILVVTVARRGISSKFHAGIFCVRLGNYAPKGEWQKGFEMKSKKLWTPGFKGKRWVPLGEYPNHVYHHVPNIYGLYRVLSQGYPHLPFEGCMIHHIPRRRPVENVVVGKRPFASCRCPSSLRCRVCLGF